MAKKKEDESAEKKEDESAEKKEDESADAAAPATCKECGKPIIDPNGDNGCGARTEGAKTVTNCMPEKSQ